MFLEVSGAVYERLKPFLDENQYTYETSDCTMPSDTQSFIHLEFSDLTDSQVKRIADQVDVVYRTLAEESVAREKRERE